jgi:hypothetical protein
MARTVAIHSELIASAGAKSNKGTAIRGWHRGAIDRSWAIWPARFGEGTNEVAARRRLRQGLSLQATGRFDAAREGDSGPW